MPMPSRAHPPAAAAAASPATAGAERSRACIPCLRKATHTGSTTIRPASLKQPHPLRCPSQSATRCSPPPRRPSPRRRRPPEMPEHRFQTSEPVELEITIPTGDIDIETIDGDESVISLEGDEKLIELTEVRQEGRRIVVELKGKKSFGITISIGDFSFGSGQLTRRVRR